MIPCPQCAEQLVEPPKNFGAFFLCHTCGFEAPDWVVQRAIGTFCAGCDNIIVPLDGEADYLCVLCRHKAAFPDHVAVVR